ncbi:MAG: helix-turn-helix transcriptional regulator [Patescibacteria group bacterium]|nr:helix-turn-helix transcriptional regulator [Patescibacteria group bacterium]
MLIDLPRWRREQGLTQHQACTKAGVSFSTWQRWERIGGVPRRRFLEIKGRVEK